MYAARRKVLRMLYDGKLAVPQAEDLLDALKSPIPATTPPVPQFVGTSDWAQNFRSTLLKLARSQAPFWLQGEAGTGKVVAAQFVHGHSSRADRPFILYPCSTEATDLFGPDKDPGILDQARGGTLVLEKPEALSTGAQLHLASLLQLAGSDGIDVRLCALTESDLDQLAQAGQFNPQLLAGLGLHLPITPLRDRPEDVLSLARHGLERLAQRDGRRPPDLSPEAEKWLLAADWTATNARQLGQLVERALILCEGDEITPDHLRLPES